MRIDKSNLLSFEQDIKSSPIYIGYLILKLLKKSKRVTLFDLYTWIKQKNGIFHFRLTMHALIFLYVSNLIEFDSPYIQVVSN